MDLSKLARKSRKGHPEEDQKGVPTTLNPPFKSDISAILGSLSCQFGTNNVHLGTHNGLRGTYKRGEGTCWVGWRAYQGGYTMILGG